jgi:hypothetical protein
MGRDDFVQTLIGMTSGKTLWIEKGYEVFARDGFQVLKVERLSVLT